MTNRRNFIKKSAFVTAGLGLNITMPANVRSHTKSIDNQASGLIGTKKQLLVDDFIIDKMTNISRKLGEVTKENNNNPILVADKPWEDPDLIRNGSVIYDKDKFRMWYMANDGIYCYAESKDGIHWTKPNLNLIEYKGSKENNIIDRRSHICLPDPHQTNPEHRYISAYIHEEIKAALAHSPDGFHWTSYNDGKPVTGRAADTTNQVFWDDESKVYRLFTRTDYKNKGVFYGGWLNEDRGTRDMINPDIIADPTNWTTVREWKFDREGKWEFKRRQPYALTGWRYEGVLFGLLHCYEWPGNHGEGPYDLVKRHELDVLNYYILTARNNQMWDMNWVYGEKPIVPRGQDGSFDKDGILPTPNIITWNDKHWLYYLGSKERHDIYIERKELSKWQCSIGVATLRLDGFVGLTAGNDPGEIITKPFILDGKNLEVNVDAKEGSFKLDVLDADGNPVDKFSGESSNNYSSVDNLRLRPEWKNKKSMSSLAGKEIRLRLGMKNATMYSFQVKDE